MTTFSIPNKKVFAAITAAVTKMFPAVTKMFPLVFILQKESERGKNNNVTPVLGSACSLFPSLTVSTVLTPDRIQYNKCFNTF